MTTGQIPHSFIEELLARIDITDVIASRVNLRRAGTNWVARCPFHTEKTPSFTVSPGKQFYHCFGCGASGDAIRFLTEYEGLHFVEAVEVLAVRAGLSIPIEAKEKKQTAVTAGLYNILAEAALFYQNQLRKHPMASKVQNYLKSRGLTGQIAKQFGLGFAPPGWDNLVKHLGTDPNGLPDLVTVGLIIKKEEGRFYDRFRDRVLFPIRDRRGRVVGFGGRIIGTEGDPKYLNSPETPVFFKGNELYGLYEARLGNRSLTELLVVEGYMDVVSLAQFGIKNVVATLGTALTEKQVELLFRQVNEIIFCFDGDKAGKEAAKRALPIILPQLKEGRRVRFLLLPEGEDPDSFVRKGGELAMLDRIQRATPLSDFLFESLTANLDLNYLDSRAQLVTLAKPLIQLLPAGVLQQMMYERLGQLSGIDAGMIQGKLTVKKGESKTRLGKPSALPPSPAYRAAALLLKNRNLISHTQNKREFYTADTPGNSLFCAIIESLNVDSSMTQEGIEQRLPPGCVSHFSFKDLEMIANSTPEVGIEQEFLGAVRRLRERAEEQAMESLLIKAKTGTLSTDEKAHLKNLLDLKAKNRVD